MTNAGPSQSREDGRTVDEVREVKFKKDFAAHAAGSVLIRMGKTHVLCGVSVEEAVPRWMRAQNVSGGWITAEYSMLPYSTDTRTRRESSTGRVGGRTQEIQRLIGRSLRAAVDLEKLGPRTLWVDCDVIQADGGTRTAAITGAYIALELAVRKLVAEARIEVNPVIESVAAVSVGVVGGTPMVDLCYTEDAGAEVDMNVVTTGTGKLIEVQGTAEEEPFAKETFLDLLALAEKGIADLSNAQAQVLDGD